MLGTIKLVILGESTTGKTSIAYRMVRDKFNQNMESTIGASFLSKIYDNIKYDIWDTAGQERYLSLVPLYYRNAGLILLVFDMDKPETMNRFTYYLDKITADLSHEYRVIVIGNKYDLVNHDLIKKIDFDVRKKMGSYEELKHKTDFVYISTKTGFNFDKLINTIKENGLKLIQTKPKVLPVEKNLIQITPTNNNNFDPIKTGKQYCYC